MPWDDLELTGISQGPGTMMLADVRIGYTNNDDPLGIVMNFLQMILLPTCSSNYVVTNVSRKSKGTRMCLPPGGETYMDRILVPVAPLGPLGC